MAHAACHHSPPEWWYPSHHAYANARIICGTCLVVEECAAAGMSEDSGMWGGLPPEERHGRRGFDLRDYVLHHAMSSLEAVMRSHGRSAEEVADVLGLSVTEAQRLIDAKHAADADRRKFSRSKGRA